MSSQVLSCWRAHANENKAAMAKLLRAVCCLRKAAVARGFNSWSLLIKHERRRAGGVSRMTRRAHTRSLGLALEAWVALLVQYVHVKMLERVGVDGVLVGR